MVKEEGSVQDLDVKGAKTAEDKPVITFTQGDPALVRDGENTLIGTVKEVKDNSVILDVKNNKDVSEKEVNKADLEPLFYVNKEDQKIWLKFSYKEVARALNNTEGVKAKIEPNQLTGLMAGERTKVMAYQVDIDNKFVNVEGRLELRRGKNGNPYVGQEVKHKELNLDLAVYGLKLDETQKKQLQEKGELGLVSGFKAGEKDFSLWVGLDKQLNKVVTRREKDIYIDKIFGVQLDSKQVEALKKGEGAVITTKNNKELFIRVMAGGTTADGLGVYKKEKAVELNLLKADNKTENQEKKNSKSKGPKI